MALPKIVLPPENATESDSAPLRGAAARVVANMESSLTIPTATSVRALPVKLLFDNRTVINNHLKRARGKVSFTHIVGYAIVKALKSMPEMNASFTTVDGKPALVTPAHVNFRAGHRRPQARRLPPTPGAERQSCGDDGFRAVLGNVRGHRASGPNRQTHRRGLCGHHHHP